jgi:transposase
MVELVRSGRAPEELSREFAPTVQSIWNWVRQAERDGGARKDAGVTSPEREELTKLRRENHRLRQERDILAKAAAWLGRGRGPRAMDGPSRSSNPATTHGAAARLRPMPLRTRRCCAGSARSTPPRMAPTARRGWASRAVLSWRLSNTLDADICALEDALARYGRPEIFNTDQGSQGGLKWSSQHRGGGWCDGGAATFGSEATR